MTGKSADVRWEQPFVNFKMALAQLKKFVEKGQLNELEEQGSSRLLNIRMNWPRMS